MNLSHLVTCCTLRWEVVFEQTTCFFSVPFGLAEENRNVPFISLNYMKCTSTILQNGPGLQGCTLPQAEGGKHGRRSKEIPPLCQAPDGRPSHGNTCWRRQTDTECCQGQNPLVGPLFAFLMGEHRLRIVLVEGFHGSMRGFNAGSEHQLVAVPASYTQLSKTTW